MPESARTPTAGGRPAPLLVLGAGLAATTCSMLLAQQFLTRIFAVLFNSGLAFLAISTTFLGLGAAGALIVACPRLFPPERSQRQIPWLAVAYTVALSLGFLLLTRTFGGGTAQDAARGLVAQVVDVGIGSLMLVPAMLCVGLVIALLLRTHAREAHRLYAADLAGGGTGCLLVLPLMQAVGGDSGLFVVAGIASIGAFLLAHAGGSRGARAASLVLAAVLFAAPLLNTERQLVDVRSHATTMAEAEGWVLEDRELERIWNPLARLGFFETRDGSSIYVRIDSSCQTGLPSQEQRFVQGHVEDTDFERLPFVLDRHERYLEIGAGGGRGMVYARELGAERIVGVEINPGITSRSLSGYDGYGVGDWVRTDEAVDYVTNEGRSYARSSDELFDTATITFIQTGVASGSAAFALSEANLFTVEAFSEFLDRVDEGGLFYVYRQGGHELLRLISMARKVLAERGVEDVRDHLYLARNATNRAVFLIGTTPFRPEEVARLDAACEAFGVEVLYSPSGIDARRPANPYPARVDELRAQGALTIGEVARLYRELAHHPAYQSLEATFIRSDDHEGLMERSVVDVSAPTDDRPYYFFLGLNDWRDFGFYFDLAGVDVLGGTVILLAWMGMAFTASALLLILLPLWITRARDRSRRVPRAPTSGSVLLAAGLYFAGLGAGYTAVQISFIQRFTLFLGHPVFSTAVVLMAFLVWSGCGSAASRALFSRRRAHPVVALVALGAILFATSSLLPRLFASDAIGWPVAGKIVVTVLVLAPVGFPMGLFFPAGLRWVDRIDARLVPWAWGANGVASISGSILALVLAIHFGFHATTLVAVGLYVVCCVPSALVLSRAAATLVPAPRRSRTAEAAPGGIRAAREGLGVPRPGPRTAAGGSTR